MKPMSLEQNQENQFVTSSLPGSHALRDQIENTDSLTNETLKPVNTKLENTAENKQAAIENIVKILASIAVKDHLKKKGINT